MLSIEPSVSAKRKRNQDTEFWRTLAAGFLSHNILRKRTPIWTRETEFHVFADTFQTCSSLSAAGSSQALSHTTLSFTFHQGFLKYFLFRWLLALASKVAKEHDLQGKQVLNLVLSGFGTMINLFLHLLKWKGPSTEDWSTINPTTRSHQLKTSGNTGKPETHKARPLVGEHEDMKRENVQILNLSTKDQTFHFLFFSVFILFSNISCMWSLISWVNSMR